MSEKMEGVVASEEEVAKGLGFFNVFEFRRWQQDCGRQVSELEHALRQAKDEASRFQWHLRRDNIILEKALQYIEAQPQTEETKKLLLGIGVVLGNKSVVDWDHVLKDWFDQIPEKE